MNWNSWIWNGEREKEMNIPWRRSCFFGIFCCWIYNTLVKGKMKHASTIDYLQGDVGGGAKDVSKISFPNLWRSLKSRSYTAKLKNNRMTKCRLWNTRECIISIADLFWKRLVNTMEPLNTAGGGDSQIQKKTSKLMKWRSNCLIQ